MKWFRFLSRRECPRGQPDCFDVFSRDDLSRLAAERNGSLTAWSFSEAGLSIDGASRFVLGLLRTRRRLRRRFPTAISAAGANDYRQWLLHDGWLSLSAPARQNIEAAFQTAPGQRVLSLYVHSPELQIRFRHGLLPVGQQEFSRWLLREGAAQFNFTSTEVLWFLHYTAEQVPAMIATTWLLNPLWQKAFPLGLTRGGQEQFLRWLHQAFDGSPGIAELESLPLLPAAVEPLLRHRIARESDLSAEPRNTERVHGVTILSHFCHASSMRQIGLNIKGALEAVGWDVSTRDVPTTPAIDLDNRAPFLGLELFPFTILNVAPGPHFRDAYERSGLLRRAGVYRIGYWKREFDQIPLSCVHLAPLVDEIWTPTAFVADGLRKRLALPVREILPALEIGEVASTDRSSLGIPVENYVFLFMFDLSNGIERKNPLAVIRAFAAAFSKRSDVSLVILVRNDQTKAGELSALKNAAHDADASVIDDHYSEAQRNGILQMCDCYISLHRSESFGASLAKAMLLGKPVIATNYSGNLAFMHSSNSFLVDYALTEIREDLDTSERADSWAEPSLDHAVAHLRYCHENREAAAALGAVAQAESRPNFSFEAAGRRMVARLEEVRASISSGPAR